MTQRIWTTFGSALPFVCAMGLTGTAQAQDATTPQANSRGPLEEVVVTAQRREEKINEIGMAIQAFSGDALDSLAVTTVNDLQNLVPSFNVTQGYQGVPIYTLRGVGFNTLNFSATSTVGTYVDEAAYAYPIMNTGPLFDIERVEILKGPQGTLYGRNTTGGLINTITNKPTKEFQSMVGADVGNYETYNAEGFISGPLFGDWIQGRLAFRTENSGRGFQVSQTRGDRLGEKEKYGVRGSLALQPTDSTNVDFSVNWFKNNSATLAAQSFALAPTVNLNVRNPITNMPGAFAPFNSMRLVDAAGNFTGAKPDDNRDTNFGSAAQRSADIGTGLGADGPLRENNPFTGLRLQIDQEINDNLRVVSLTNYNYFERDALSDFSGSDAEISLQELKGKINSFAQELRIEGSTEGGINWLAGGYYANDRILDTNRTLVNDNVNVLGIRQIASGVLALDNVPLIDPVSGQPVTLPGGAIASAATQFLAPAAFAQGLLFPIGTFTNNGLNITQTDIDQGFREFQDGGTLKTESMSVFANADVPLSDQLKLTVGARYTEEQQDFAGCSRDFNGNLIPTFNLANRFLFATGGTAATNPSFGQVTDTFNTVGGCVTFDARTNKAGIVTSTLDESNTSWRAGLDYKVTEGTLLYTTISRGFKAGTTPLNASNSAQQNAPVKQEKLTAYEIGAKSSLFDRRVQVNIGTFYYDYKDKQINTFFNDPIFVVLARLDNVPESELYGVDADVTIRATDSLSFNLNVLGLHSEVKEYMGTDLFGNPFDAAGTEFPLTPKFTYSATTFYQTELGASWNLAATLNARYQKRGAGGLGSDVQGLPADLFDIPGFLVMNGSVGVTSADGLWSVGLFGRNLLDKYYFQSIASNANTIVRFASEPRTFGLTAQRRF